MAQTSAKRIELLERERGNSARHEADEVEGDLLLLYNVIIIHRQDHGTQGQKPRGKLRSSKAKPSRGPRGCRGACGS